MAMPLSGCIGIISCPNGATCSSIAQAVDGNITGSKSLSTLSTTAGKTTPHCMREFYGYSSGSNIVIDYSGAAVVLCQTMYCNDVYIPLAFVGRSVGNIITVCFDYSGSVFKLHFACWYTSENGGAWVGRAYTNSTASGSFAVTGIDYNDSLCVRMQLENISELNPDGSMCVSLQNPPAVFTSGSGIISRTIPYGCQIFLGFLPE